MERSYDEFVERVRQALVRLSFEDAERASVATLSTLSEVITPEAAKNLGSHLPTEMADKLDYEPPDEGFSPPELSLDEFLDIVAEKEGSGVAMDEARNHAIAVMKAVREAYGVGADIASGGDGLTSGVEETELNEIREQLGEDFSPLFH